MEYIGRNNSVSSIRRKAQRRHLEEKFFNYEEDSVLINIDYNFKSILFIDFYGFFLSRSRIQVTLLNFLCSFFLFFFVCASVTGRHK